MITFPSLQRLAVLAVWPMLHLWHLEQSWPQVLHVDSDDEWMNEDRRRGFMPEKAIGGQEGLGQDALPVVNGQQRFLHCLSTASLHPLQHP